MSSISLCLLTWNRASVFIETMDISLRNMGMEVDEIIWVDNGSEPDQYARMEEFMMEFKNVTKVRFHHNTGMARGFNSAFAMSRSDYVVLSGPDVFHPYNWMKIFYDYMETILNAGIIAQYVVPIDSVPERYGPSKEIEYVNGLPVYRALPFDHFCIRRSLLSKVGYFREDFGLYGWSDVELLRRFEHKLPGLGYGAYVVPNVMGNHLAGAGADEFRKEGEPDYCAWKQKEARLASNTQLVLKCQSEGYPYYSPF